MLNHPIVFLLLTSSYPIGPSRTGHTPSTTEPGTTAQGTLRSRYGMEESVQVPVPKIKVGSNLALFSLPSCRHHVKLYIAALCVFVLCPPRCCYCLSPVHFALISSQVCVSLQRGKIP
ncbi:hypothetical protein TNCV_551681 [Trichonephila clavipes]|nr:hypothetical protein TNCV_551681 [Trichonephila clavipes]